MRHLLTLVLNAFCNNSLEVHTGYAENKHKANIFLLFLDLRKAYISVPQEASWVAVDKLLIELTQPSFRIRKRQFEVDNGLRQGCCMAPVHFNSRECNFLSKRTPTVHSHNEAHVVHACVYGMTV